MIEQIVSSIDNLLLYFVPGYLTCFIYIKVNLNYKKMDDLNLMVIVVISFFEKILLDGVVELVNLDFDTKVFNTVLMFMALILGYIIAKLVRTHIFLGILKLQN